MHKTQAIPVPQHGPVAREAHPEEATFSAGDLPARIVRQGVIWTLLPGIGMGAFVAMAPCGKIGLSVTLPGGPDFLPRSIRRVLDAEIEAYRPSLVANKVMAS